MKNSDFDKIARDQLTDLNGFALKAPLIFMAPIDHTLRGICFDRSDDPRSFYVETFFLPLFIPRTHLSFEFGHRLRRSNGLTCWNADAKDLRQELTRAIELDALPFLSKINTPSDVARAARALLNPSNPHYQQTLVFALARAGEFAKASTALNKLVKQTDPAVPWQREMAGRALSFKNLLSTYPSQAQRQLDEWELQSIQNLGLEKFRSTEA